MSHISQQFGYLPEHCDITYGNITITTLYDLTQKIEGVESSITTHRGWIYAPIVGTIDNPPIKSSRIFHLPKTHIITHHKAISVHHLDFILWIFGYLQGIRFTPEGHGYIDATPIKKHQINDFIILRNSARHSLAIADTFFKKQKNNNSSLFIASAIHCIMLSSIPNYLHFEKFNLMIQSIDACWKSIQEMNITQIKKTIPHAQRIRIMCETLKIPTPEWAQCDKNGKTYISSIRNSLIHEGLYFNKPLGYSNQNREAEYRNILFQLKNLISRIILSLLVDDESINRYKLCRLLDRNMKGIKLSPSSPLKPPCPSST
ncbi:MAG: hypothetical protein ACK5JO_05585 [Halodesulfovibrio sp.]